MRLTTLTDRWAAQKHHRRNTKEEINLKEQFDNLGKYAFFGRELDETVNNTRKSVQQI